MLPEETHGVPMPQRSYVQTWPIIPLLGFAVAHLLDALGEAPWTSDPPLSLKL
jgi:hypothetical protein